MARNVRILRPKFYLKQKLQSGDQKVRAAEKAAAARLRIAITSPDFLKWLPKLPQVGKKISAVRKK